MAPVIHNSLGRKHGYPNPAQNVVGIPPEIGQFAQQTKMNICQINGERMYGPSFLVDQSWIPEAGSEVFVGRLPRDLFEPELVPFLAEAGPIYQLRLMMDFSGTNKGYCFVKYFDPEHAQRALDMLHRKQVRPGFPVVVSKSMDNKRLLLRGVPTFTTKEQVYEAIRQISGGVVHVELTWDEGNPITPHGIVFVTYSCHHAAALARKNMLSAPPLYLWGKKITTDWAEPIIQPHKNFRFSRILLLENFDPGTEWRLLMEYFGTISISGVKFIQMSGEGTQAYVLFYTRMHAEVAKAVLNGASFYGSNILRVRWSAPEEVPERRRPTNRPRCLLPIEAGQSSGEIGGIEQQLSVEISQVEQAVPAVSLSPSFQPYYAQPNYQYLQVYMPFSPVPHGGYVNQVAVYPEQSPAFWPAPFHEPGGYQPVYMGYPTIANDWNGGTETTATGAVNEDGTWAMDRE